MDGNETRNRVIICEHGLDDIESTIPLGFSMKPMQDEEILLKDYTLFIRYSARKPRLVLKVVDAFGLSLCYKCSAEFAVAVAIVTGFP